METSDMEKNAGSPELQVVNGLNKECFSQGIFLPLAILMIAVLLALGWNLYLANSQSGVWRKQVMQRDVIVNQARGLQADLQKIAHDLMALSATDSDARAIVQKYQIKPEPVPASQP